MKKRIFVTLKPGVLDPQGRAVHHALDGLGYAGVNDVRIGRLIELEDPSTLVQRVRFPRVQRRYGASR